MRRNQYKNHNLISKISHKQGGFSVVELLVVFVIIVLISGLIIVNWNKQTPQRSLVLAQNELISNMKKVQSYAISTKNISGGTEGAKFYAIKLVTGSSSYTIHAVDENYSLSTPVETITIPYNISIYSLALSNTVGGVDETPACIFLVYSSVYGKPYFVNGVNNCTGLATDLSSLPDLDPRNNFDMSVQIQHTAGGRKGIAVSGSTGRVDAYNPKSKAR